MELGTCRMGMHGTIERTARALCCLTWRRDVVTNVMVLSRFLSGPYMQDSMDSDDSVAIMAQVSAVCHGFVCIRNNDPIAVWTAIVCICTIAALTQPGSRVEPDQR